MAHIKMLIAFITSFDAKDFSNNYIRVYKKVATTFFLVFLQKASVLSFFVVVSNFANYPLSRLTFRK